MAYEQLKLDNQLCFRLYTASRLITSSYTPFIKDMGITYLQYLVLMMLWEKDDRIVSEITDKLLLETNTVTPLLQRMEKEGLVVRKKGTADSRQRIISLTLKGKKLEEMVKEVPGDIARQVVKGISSEDLQAMVPLLDKLIAALRQIG